MENDINDRDKEAKIIGSEYEEPDSHYINVSRSICKIRTPSQLGTGFFLKCSIDDKVFYCLMSNEHVINDDIINNMDKINVSYDN